MFTLAKETGWSESYILWELPLHRALAYQHCALWQAGAWTVRPQPAPEEQLRLLECLSAVDDSEEEE